MWIFLCLISHYYSYIKGALSIILCIHLHGRGKERLSSCLLASGFLTPSPWEITADIILPTHAIFLFSVQNNNSFFLDSFVNEKGSILIFTLSSLGHAFTLLCKSTLQRSLFLVHFARLSKGLSSHSKAEFQVKIIACMHDSGKNPIFSRHVMKYSRAREKEEEVFDSCFRS